MFDAARVRENWFSLALILAACWETGPRASSGKFWRDADRNAGGCASHRWQGAHSVRAAAGRGLPALPSLPAEPSRIAACDTIRLTAVPRLLTMPPP